ncbi:hypothetical protein KCV06_g575, partial [Aureobasidium melanogenum]
MTQPITPVEAATWVLKAAIMPRTEALSALPPLKPNQPNTIRTVPTKTKVEFVSQSCPTTRDVDGTTASVVERGKLGKPTIGIPCPAGDGAVDNGAPAETEDERRKDATTLESTTNDDLDCASGEEKLVETEDDFRNDGTARLPMKGPATAIEQTDTRNDQVYEETADNEVNIASIWGCLQKARMRCIRAVVGEMSLKRLLPLHRQAVQRG